MIHNYVKQADFDGNVTKLANFAWPALVNAVKSEAGTAENATGSLKLINGQYHIVGCSSPEYKCYPPFESRACSTKEDCNYELSQIRWGLETVLNLTQRFNLENDLAKQGVDASWWSDLLTSKLAWYPYDNVTGKLVWHSYDNNPNPNANPNANANANANAYANANPYDNVAGFRLDQNCAFECPHRHFSHLLQIYDLETVQYDASPFMSDLVHKSVDNWFRVTCNRSNWFNEECRGFTQCGMASMNAVSNRPEAAVGNLSHYIHAVVTPNGMYGEMVSDALQDMLRDERSVCVFLCIPNQRVFF